MVCLHPPITRHAVEAEVCSTRCCVVDILLYVQVDKREENGICNVMYVQYCRPKYEVWAMCRPGYLFALRCFIENRNSCHLII